MCVKCVKNPSLTRDSFCADSGTHLANFATCTGCDAASNALIIKVFFSRCILDKQWKKEQVWPFLPAAAGLHLAIFLVLIFFFFCEVENQAIRRPKQAI